MEPEDSGGEVCGALSSNWNGAGRGRIRENGIEEGSKLLNAMEVGPELCTARVFSSVLWFGEAM